MLSASLNKTFLSLSLLFIVTRNCWRSAASSWTSTRSSVKRRVTSSTTTKREESNCETVIKQKKFHKFPLLFLQNTVIMSEISCHWITERITNIDVFFSVFKVVHLFLFVWVVCFFFYHMLREHNKTFIRFSMQTGGWKYFNFFF